MNDVNHTARLHAPMSASRIPRIIACPASYKLENLMPQEVSSSAAARGTYIHEIAEKILKANGVTDAFYDENAEDLEIAMDYVEFIHKLSQNAKKCLYEYNVNKGLQSIHPDFGGTADAVIIKDKELHVVDLKTGRVPVGALQNTQLMTYALGVARQLNAPDDIDVHLHIWQPNNVSSWRWGTWVNLIEFKEQLERAAAIAESVDAPTNPSNESCKYCKAKTICPAIKSKVQDAARSDFFQAVQAKLQAKKPKEASPEVLRIKPEDLDLAELALSYAQAVKEAAKLQIKRLEEISGWTLKPGRKMIVFTDSEQAERIFKDIPSAWTLKSASEIKKLGLSNEVLEGVFEEKYSEPSLARVK